MGAIQSWTECPLEKSFFDRQGYITKRLNREENFSRVSIMGACLNSDMEKKENKTEAEIWGYTILRSTRNMRVTFG